VCVSAAPEKATPHGGGGFILSVGLLRRITVATARTIIANTWGCSGSDCLLHRILWAQGLAFTDPGPGLFSRDRQLLLFDGLGRERLELCAHAIASNSSVQDGRLPGTTQAPGRCRWAVANGVSGHVHARNTTVEAAAHEVAQAHLLYGRLLERLDREVAAGQVAAALLDLMAEALLAAGGAGSDGAAGEGGGGGDASWR
jgi:hypothetical protein